MPLFYSGLSETVRATSDNPEYEKRFRPTAVRGITIYRIAGVWYTGRDLGEAALMGADRVYLGGYLFDVPDEELYEMEQQGLHTSFARDVFLDRFTETF